MKFINLKILIPIFVVVGVAVIVAKTLSDREEAVVVNEEATVTTTTTEETVSAISSDNPLQADLYEPINYLVDTYLKALADGDVDTIASITNNMTEIERIRVIELGKYIEAFPEYNVFTKFGPQTGSYIVYAAARAKFPGIDKVVPGIYCFYVCEDEDGSYYFNEGVLTEEEQIYIDAINADEAVVSLMENIDMQYQQMIKDDAQVRNYIEIMQNEIRGAVGTALAAKEEENAESTETKPEDPTLLYEACQAKTTDTINVRSSDSETADKLGSIARGTVIDVMEIRVNGWSKIMYKGNEAYVKTDYLQVIEEPEEAGTGENTAQGTVIANTTVNVRSDASTSADRMGQVSKGQKLDWISDLDNGWSKIIYNDKVGYIKSEYLDKQ